MTKAYNYFSEFIKTLSGRVPSFFSAKRLERFLFITVTISCIITCVIYEVVKDKLTATEITILTSPLLIAAGYNMTKSEEAKKANTENKPDGES